MLAHQEDWRRGSLGRVDLLLRFLSLPWWLKKVEDLAQWEGNIAYRGKLSILAGFFLGFITHGGAS